MSGVVEIVVRMQAAVPGDPSAGPYPASVSELADEIADALAEMETSAPGLRAWLVKALEDRLMTGYRAEDWASYYAMLRGGAGA